MNKTLKIFLAFILFFTSACKEEIPPPLCSINNPHHEQEFFDDEDIPVTVIADDPNGIITSVLLVVNNKNYSATAEFPFNFTLKAGDITPGTNTIKAVAHNNTGKRSEASVKIIINEKRDESPDFVSFSDGKIPKGWITNGWYFDPTWGYDDSASLFSIIDSAKVSATKTCNYIEFYWSGFCYINFYIDGRIWEEMKPTFLSWTKFYYSFPDGYHTFEWEHVIRTGAGNYGVRLDAIKFETRK
jgi:hypothetical protein